MGGNGRDPKPNHTQQRRLIWWAFGFSIVVSGVSAVPATFVFDIPVLFAFVPFAVFLVLLWLANRRTVRVMHKQAPLPNPPWWRVVLTCLLAIFVSYAMVLWILKSEIDSLRADTEQFQRDRNAAAEILGRPVPDVAQDPEVRRLDSQLGAKEVELDRAEQELQGEVDGRRGTMDKGEGPASREKRSYRDRLARETADLRGQLGTARIDVQRRIDQLLADQDAAGRRIAEIDDEQRGRGPALFPETGQLRAVWLVAGQNRSMAAAAVTFGSLAAFLSLDCLALLFVVRHVCRGGAGKRGSVSDRIRRQRKLDRQTTQGVKQPEELSSEMTEKYFPKVTTSRVKGFWGWLRRIRRKLLGLKSKVGE